MPLSAGTYVGPYQILAAIGAGGMGEVYRARDTKLGRDVALKILPETFAADAERLARFEREARTLASLNHPHIAQIYGLEGGALVMEFVDGETLADRLTRGAIPIDDARPLARQIAEALEAAHEQGIVHRDLKPLNIKVRPDGTVKVLDFGLAKAAGFTAPDSATFASPAVTQAGMIVGTPAYMSPEQAKGSAAIDRRADIWSFGVVLYEMLTGHTAFNGETASDTLAAVIRAPLTLNDLPASTPASMRHLLRRCLERDPRRRLRDIGEARVLLEQAVEDDVPVVRSPWTSAIPWAISGGLAVALAAVVLRPATPVRVTTSTVSTIPLPPGASFAFSGSTPGPLTVSPDGLRIALALVHEGQTRLWVRELDAATFRVLPGTEGAHYPFWSADNRSIGFFADNALRVVDISGGLPRVVATTLDGKGAAWNAEGTIVFTPDATAALFRVDASQRTPVSVTTLSRDTGENSHRFPAFLPDGRTFLFLTRGVSDIDAAVRGGSIRLGSLAGGVDRVLTTTESHAVYAAGHILHVQPRTSTLVARPFDARRLDWTGDPRTVAEDVLVLGSGMRGVFDASQNGVLAYVSTAMRIPQELAWFSRAGIRSGSITEIGDYAFELSPDGGRVAFQEIGTSSAEDLWMIETRRGIRTRVTRTSQAEGFPVWAPDGRSLVYSARSAGTERIFWRSMELGANEVTLYSNARSMIVTDWSRDGRFLLFNVADSSSEAGVWVLPLSDSTPPKAGPARRIVATRGLGGSAISRDGQWIAYTSLESGIQQVFVTRFADAQGTRQVSTTGGAHPRWRGDGKELYYVTRTGGIMAVSMQPRPLGGMEIDAPTLLFETGRPVDAYIPFNVTDDGQRFLVLAPRERTDTPTITLITNWTRMLVATRR